MNPEKKRQAKIIAITIIITVILTLVVVVIVISMGLLRFVDKTIATISSTALKDCEAYQPIIRGKVFVDSKYNRELASCLLDIGSIASTAFCKQTTPLPPPFTAFKRLYGYDRKGVKNLYGIVYWSDISEMAVISFAGTYNESQWYSNLRVKQIATTNLTRSPVGAMVHSGFYDIYTSIRDQIWDWWYNQCIFRVKTLFMTGRSLGGALSTICAYDMHNLIGVQIIHYSFASPRVGNIVFADEFNRRIACSFRTYNTEDIITNLPGAIMRGANFKHVGLTSHNRPFTKHLGAIYSNHVDAYEELFS